MYATQINVLCFWIRGYSLWYEVGLDRRFNDLLHWAQTPDSRDLHPTVTPLR